MNKFCLKSSRPRRLGAGFTLIEVLVALALLCAVMLLTTVALRNASGKTLEASGAAALSATASYVKNDLRSGSSRLAPAGENQVRTLSGSEIVEYLPPQPGGFYAPKNLTGRVSYEATSPSTPGQVAVNLTLCSQERCVEQRFSAPRPTEQGQAGASEAREVEVALEGAPVAPGTVRVWIDGEGHSVGSSGYRATLSATSQVSVQADPALSNGLAARATVLRGAPGHYAVRYALEEGRVTLTSDTAVLVTGANLTRTWPASGTYLLPSGDYLLSAAAQSGQNFAVLPSPRVRVEGGSEQSVYTAAEPRVGSLDVQINGLVGGETPVVRVSGPQGGVSVLSSRSLALPPGHYTIEASPLARYGSLLRPTLDASTVQISAGSQAVVRIQYSGAVGVLGSVRLVSNVAPSSVSVRLIGDTGAIELRENTPVPSGLYRVQADPVFVGGRTLEPSAVPYLAIQAGETSVLTVRYDSTAPGQTCPKRVCPAKRPAL